MARRASPAVPGARAAKAATTAADIAARAHAAEQRRLDLNAGDLGVPVEALMANAGRALAREALRRLGRRAHDGDGPQVVVLCGKGNNGGDGFAAAAELLARGAAVHVVLAEPPARILGAAARRHFVRLPRAAWSMWRGRPQAAWREASVVLDCLLGSGQRGAPRGPYAALARWANARRGERAAVVSCDVPSGHGSALAVRPTATVALHAAAPGLSRGTAGEVLVRSIGIPAEARHVGFGDAMAAFPEVRGDSHKGDNGTVLVVGGSVPLLGAPHYVAMGAYRTGADLVHAVVPPDAAPAVRSWGPAAIVHAAGQGAAGQGGHLTLDALPAIERLLERSTALAIGPGLGRHPSTLAAAREVLAAAADQGVPTVVDADGLDAVDAELLKRHGARMVLTPHGREFLDLAGRPATRANVAAYAQRHGTVVLRKGAVDVVAGGASSGRAAADRQVLVRECHRGHPTMTVGGTGDVLTGIVAALLAKGVEPWPAACAASYLSKAAGETAAQVRSYGATAEDVAEALPSVLARIEARRQAKA